MYLEVPILVCSPSVKNTLVLSPLCDPPSGELTCMSQERACATTLVQPSLRRTHLYGNLPDNNVIVDSNRC
jgi:hypothetical protein